VASSSGTVLLVVLALAGIGLASEDDRPGDADVIETGGDDDFSYAPSAGASSSGLPRCDDAVVAESGAVTVVVPGEGALLDSSTDLVCEVDEGSDAEAVTVLQDALVRCNGQPITVDGELGPATRAAVTNVQQQHGLATDGAYGPATMRVMQWPTADGATCAPAPVAS
jgi:hypothetical protein